MAASDFLFANTHVRVHERFQVVDVVDVNIFEKVHAGIDIAGNRNIDQEQGPIGTTAHGGLDIRTVQNGRGAPCRTHDDVGFHHRSETVSKFNGAPSELGGQQLCPVE